MSVVKHTSASLCVWSYWVVGKVLKGLARSSLTIVVIGSFNKWTGSGME